jgi:hypothetical protein
MPPEKRRRSGEPQYSDPAEESLIKRISKMEFGNPSVDMILRTILLLAMGGGVGAVTSEVRKADVEVVKSEVAALRAELAGVHAEYAKITERRYRDRANYDRRFVKIELKLGITPPPLVRTEAAGATQ